jgi:hypothetical protein
MPSAAGKTLQPFTLQAQFWQKASPKKIHNKATPSTPSAQTINHQLRQLLHPLA